MGRWPCLFLAFQPFWLSLGSGRHGGIADGCQGGEAGGEAGEPLFQLLSIRIRAAQSPQILSR